MPDLGTMVGLKFYKYDENKKLNVLRLTNIKNSDLFVLKDKDNKTVKLTKAQMNEYTQLNPDGYITFCVAQLDEGIQDIIVSLHRKQDLQNNDNCPYAVCRQNILDLFTNQIVKENDTVYIGASISQETCPDDIDFKIMLACNGFTDVRAVSVYIDDTFEDIMSLIKTTKYDSLLKELYIKVDNVKLKGYTTSLRQLLEENYFMFDFYAGFSIRKVDIDIKNNMLTEEQIVKVEDIIKYRMANIYMIPFDKDINLSKVQRDYILLSDSNDKLYFIGYDKGKYINRPYSSLDDKRDMLALKKYSKNI